MQLFVYSENLLSAPHKKSQDEVWLGTTSSIKPACNGCYWLFIILIWWNENRSTHSFRRSTILPSKSSIPLSKKFVLRSACGGHCLWEPTSATHTHRHSTGDWKHDFVSCADPNAQCQPTAKNSNQHFHAFLLSKVWSNICFLKLHQHLCSHSIATTRISTMMDPPPLFFTEQQFSNNDDITAMFLVRLIMHQQAEKQQCPRMNWEDQAALKEPVNAFSWHCHMTLRSFEKLVRILSPLLKEDER